MECVNSSSDGLRRYLMSLWDRVCGSDDAHVMRDEAKQLIKKASKFHRQ